MKLRLSRVFVNRQEINILPVVYPEQKTINLSRPYPGESSYFFGGDRKGNAFISRMAYRAPDRPHGNEGIIEKL